MGFPHYIITTNSSKLSEIRSGSMSLEKVIVSEGQENLQGTSALFTYASTRDSPSLLLVVTVNNCAHFLHTLPLVNLLVKFFNLCWIHGIFLWTEGILIMGSFLASHCSPKYPQMLLPRGKETLPGTVWNNLEVSCRREINDICTF